MGPSELRFLSLLLVSAALVWFWCEWCASRARAPKVIVCALALAVPRLNVRPLSSKGCVVDATVCVAPPLPQCSYFATTIVVRLSVSEPRKTGKP